MTAKLVVSISYDDGSSVANSERTVELSPKAIVDLVGMNAITQEALTKLMMGQIDLGSQLSSIASDVVTKVVAGALGIEAPAPTTLGELSFSMPDHAEVVIVTSDEDDTTNPIAVEIIDNEFNGAAVEIVAGTPSLTDESVSVLYEVRSALMVGFGNMMTDHFVATENTSFSLLPIDWDNGPMVICTHELTEPSQEGGTTVLEAKVPVRSFRVTREDKFVDFELRAIEDDPSLVMLSSSNPSVLDMVFTVPLNINTLNSLATDIFSYVVNSTNNFGADISTAPELAALETSVTGNIQAAPKPNEGKVIFVTGTVGGEAKSVETAGAIPVSLLEALNTVQKEHIASAAFVAEEPDDFDDDEEEDFSE